MVYCKENSGNEIAINSNCKLLTILGELEK